MRYFSSYEISLILKHFTRTKRIKIRTQKNKSHLKSHSKQSSRNVCGSSKDLKDFCPKKVLPRQENKLTAGNLRGCCRPSDEIQKSEIHRKPGN